MGLWYIWRCTEMDYHFGAEEQEQKKSQAGPEKVLRGIFGVLGQKKASMSCWWWKKRPSSTNNWRLCDAGHHCRGTREKTIFWCDLKRNCLTSRDDFSGIKIPSLHPFKWKYQALSSTIRRIFVSCLARKKLHDWGIRRNCRQINVTQMSAFCGWYCYRSRRTAQSMDIHFKMQNMEIQLNAND